MRYSNELGCRYRGIPHELGIIYQNDIVKWERCLLCNKKFKFNKGYKGRVDNQEYLKSHVRNFCQKTGATSRIYHKIYRPKETIIKL